MFLCTYCNLRGRVVQYGRSCKQDHTQVLLRAPLTTSEAILFSTLMAFVHPSRMGLVPKDSRSSGRLPSPHASSAHPRPSSTNRGHDRSVDRHPRRSRDEDYNGEREQGGRNRSRERRRDRGRSSERDVHRDQDRHRHRSNGDRYKDRRDENRDSSSRGPRSQRDDDRSSARSSAPPSKPPLGRASPTYDDYSRRQAAPSLPPQDDRSGRPDPPPENGAPWHQQENMYRRDGRMDGGVDYFER